MQWSIDDGKEKYPHKGRTDNGKKTRKIKIQPKHREKGIHKICSGGSNCSMRKMHKPSGGINQRKSTGHEGINGSSNDSIDQKLVENHTVSVASLPPLFKSKKPLWLFIYMFSHRATLLRTNFYGTCFLASVQGSYPQRAKSMYQKTRHVPGLYFVESFNYSSAISSNGTTAPS